MKHIVCTFNDAYYGLLRAMYVAVDDDFNVYGSFVDNHSFHQMKKKEKAIHKPISELLCDGYGQKVYNTLLEFISIKDDSIEISPTHIQYIQKD